MDMIMNKWKFALPLIIAAVTLSCESLEDTYKDYAGDGKVRYVGKCSNATLEEGWRRFVLNWENSADATITNILITWDEGDGSVLLDADATSYTTDATFENRPYDFVIQAVDHDGNKSLPISLNGRPFTHEHDLIRGFSKAVSKHFFVGGKLVLFLDSYNENLTSAKLTYFSGGLPQSLELTKEIFDGKYKVVDDVDRNGEVFVERTANIADCIDKVIFDPHPLKSENYAVLNMDFRQQVIESLALTEINDALLSSQETIYIDYSLNSLEDILYFTNLKKVVLGGMRYMNDTSLANLAPLSTLQNTETSLFALNFMHDVLGVEVEIYNNHFDIFSELSFATDKGNPVLPKLTYLDNTGWTIENLTYPASSNPDVYPYNEGFPYAEAPAKLFDNNPATRWEPYFDMYSDPAAFRTHELLIDMQQVETVSGFRITQTTQVPANAWSAPILRSDFITVLISTDGKAWEQAHSQAYRDIGPGIGESTIIKLPATKNIQYVKLVITDVQYTYLFKTSLGDFMVF